MTSVWYATGAVVSIALMLRHHTFMPPRASIGLERIVGPIVTMFVSLIGSAILGGIVYVVAGRRPAGAGVAISVDAEAILRNAARRGGHARSAPQDHEQSDWRTVAKQVAADPDATR